MKKLLILLIILGCEPLSENTIPLSPFPDNEGYHTRLDKPLERIHPQTGHKKIVNNDGRALYYSW